MALDHPNPEQASAQKVVKTAIEKAPSEDKNKTKAPRIIKTKIATKEALEQKKQDEILSAENSMVEMDDIEIEDVDSESNKKIKGARI